MHLGTRDSPSAPHLRAHLNSKITNEKHKNAKDVAPNRPWKGHLFIAWKLKQEDKALFDLSWEHVYLVIQLFGHSVHSHEWLRKYWEYWFGSYKEILASRWVCRYGIMIDEDWLYTSDRWTWWTGAWLCKMYWLYLCWQDRFLNLQSCQPALPRQHTTTSLGGIPFVSTTTVFLKL